MPVEKILPSEGAEIYVDEQGYICIKQGAFEDEQNVVFFRPDEIHILVERLLSARNEALSKK
jgi:hypothetical protein